MGYPVSTLKIVLGGPLATDIWRTSVDFGVSPGDAPNSGHLDNLITDKVLPRVLTFWNSIKPFNIPNCKLDFVGCYFYPAGSSVAASLQTRAFTAVAGTAVSAVPFRTALVASKITAFAGRRNRGRMYLPATGDLSLVQGTGQTTPAIAGVVANAVAALLGSWNTDDWSAYHLLDQGAVVTSPTAVGAPNLVGQIRVDTLPDTQRRRTNKDLPTGVSNAVVTPPI